MTDTTPRRGGPRRGQALEALRHAVAQGAPQRLAQDALSVDELTTRPQLDALADRLESLHADLMLGGQDNAHRSRVALGSLEDVRRAADVVRAAATHGYPRPALEQLGQQAEAIPTARTSDPSTSHEARPRVPSRRNALGRFLIGFRDHELHTDDDPALTSEEVARRLRALGSEYAKRCSELLALGYIRVARDDDGHERTRQGASGRQRLVFELTPDGRTLADRIIAEQ